MTMLKRTQRLMLALLVSLLSQFAFVECLQAQSVKRPNVLFILTDDQSPLTLGAYGNTVCSTPNIDRLAKEGMLFHDAHHMGAWSGAVCRPSRTMIMTGRTVWRIPGAALDAKSEEGKKRNCSI